MARLHLLFKEDDFNPLMLELTQRFFAVRPWRQDGQQGRKFDTWLHGACILYELPYPDLHINIEDGKKNPGAVGRYEATPTGGTIILVKYSVISLFHQFRHHMVEHMDGIDGDDLPREDAQAWACSLFYRTDKSKFRRAVRRHRVAGVYAEDLLKRKRTK